MGFGGYLQANTAVDVLIGPFIDDTDGKTAETALTLSQADIKLSKNGQALTQKNDDTAAAHDANGYYNCELNATDTNTEGTLTLIVHETGALPVRHDFMVLSQAAYTSLVTAKDAGYMDVNVKAISDDTTAPDNLELMYDGTGYAGGTTKLDVNVVTIAANAITATAINADAITNAKIADNAIAAENLAADCITNAKIADNAIAAENIAADAITAAKIANGAIDAATFAADVDAEIATMVWNAATASYGGAGTYGQAVEDVRDDTNELQTDWHDGGRLDSLLDGASAPSAATVADAVWDEALAGHAGVGSAGAALTAAGSAGDPWATALPGSYGAGTAGLLLGTTIPNAITTIDNEIAVIDGIVDDILVDTGTTLDTLVKDIPTNAELASAFTEIKGATWSAATDTLEHIRDKETDIETDTQDLQTQVGVDGAGLTALPWNAAWDAEVQSECTDALNAYDPPTNAEMELRTLPAADYTVVSDLGTVQTGDCFAIVNGDHGLVSIQDDVDAIKAKTDSLTFTEAGQVDANVQSINDVAITGDGSATPFNVV
jgi:hypothetical protein